MSITSLIRHQVGIQSIIIIYFGILFSMSLTGVALCLLRLLCGVKIKNKCFEVLVPILTYGMFLVCLGSSFNTEV